MPTPRICAIDGCSNQHYARDWCHKHWQRWWKHGDPLVVLNPIGEPLEFLTSVVLPYTGDDCITWPFARSPKGYAKMQYNGRYSYVTRVLCEIKNGPPPTPEHEAAHSCGKGHEGCVTPLHARWATPAENQADRLAHGTSNRGTRHGMAKLTEADVLQILALKGARSQRVIAAMFNVSRGAVSHIHKGECWGWLQSDT